MLYIIMYIIIYPATAFIGKKSPHRKHNVAKHHSFSLLQFYFLETEFYCLYFQFCYKLFWWLSYSHLSSPVTAANCWWPCPGNWRCGSLLPFSSSASSPLNMGIGGVTYIVTVVTYRNCNFELFFKIYVPCSATFRYLLPPIF